MEPKEKAKELTGKMSIWHWKIIESGTSVCNHEYAKECAILAVLEILNNENSPLEYESDIEYWQEVKQEIQKL